MNHIDNLLSQLFDRAKNHDALSEWEFIQTIMREKYSCNMYNTSQIIDDDNLYDYLNKETRFSMFNRQILEENINFINSLISIGNEEKNFYNMIRLRLITYSYITETKYIQDIICNLLWIIKGKPFYTDPFAGSIINKNFSKSEKEKLLALLGFKTMGFKSLSKTEKRMSFICYLCKKTNNVELANYITSFYDSHLRNTVYHSKYIFDKEGYIGFDNKCTIRLSFEELANRINKCIYFYISIIDLIDKHQKKYKKTITIKGRKSVLNDAENEKRDIVDTTIIANNRIGIVSTMQHFSNDKNNDDNRSDDFLNDIIKFTEDYDLLLKNMDD